MCAKLGNYSAAFGTSNFVNLANAACIAVRGKSPEISGKTRLLLTQHSDAYIT